MAVTIIVIVIVVVLLAAAVGILLRRQRALQQRFGPEYDRLAAEVGPRRARSELAERERRIAQLDIRPLSAERRAAYDTQWATLQEAVHRHPVAGRGGSGLSGHRGRRGSRLSGRRPRAAVL